MERAPTNGGLTWRASRGRRRPGAAVADPRDDDDAAGSARDVRGEAGARPRRDALAPSPLFKSSGLGQEFARAFLFLDIYLMGTASMLCGKGSRSRLRGRRVAAPRAAFPARMLAANDMSPSGARRSREAQSCSEHLWPREVASRRERARVPSELWALSARGSMVVSGRGPDLARQWNCGTARGRSGWKNLGRELTFSSRPFRRKAPTVCLDRSNEERL